MGDDKKYEPDLELEAELDAILDEQPEDLAVVKSSDQVKVRLGIAVNGYKRGDEMVVDRDHPFFGGLIDQGMAEVIG